MNTERRGLLLGVAAFTAWGLLSPGNEILLRQYTPMWMNVIRAALACLLLFAWLGPRGLGKAVDLLRRPQLVAALFIGTVVSFALFGYAQTRVPATVATLGFYTSPLWTAVFARMVLGEKAGWWFLPAVVALLGGGFLALTGGTLERPDTLGVILAVGTGLTWGAYSVLLRKTTADVAWRELLFASMLLGLLCFTAVAATTEPFPDMGAFTATTWMWTLIHVLVPTIAALAMFQSAIKMAPASKVNLLVGFELAATVLFAWLLLDASFSGVQLAGLAISLIAVSWYLWVRGRSDEPSGDRQANNQ